MSMKPSRRQLELERKLRDRHPMEATRKRSLHRVLGIGLIADGIAAFLGFVYRLYMEIANGLLLKSGWWPHSLHLGVVSLTRTWGGVLLDHGGAAYNPKHPAFGALGNGVADDTVAFEACVTAMGTVSPPGHSGYGMGKMEIGAGSFVISDWDLASAIGLRIQGAAMYATTLLFKTDTGVAIDIGTYIELTFADLTLMHVPVDSDATTWSCIGLSLQGNSGGRALHMERVGIRGFDHQVQVEAATNNDTVTWHDCYLERGNVHVFGESSQAVCWSYEGGAFNRFNEWCFDISGMGHLSVRNMSVTLYDGFFNLQNDSGNYGQSSVYTFENLKFEARIADGETDAFARLIRVGGAFVVGQAKFINCGISGGDLPDGSTNNYVEMSASQFQLEFLGGSYDAAGGGVQQTGTTGHDLADNSYILFQGCRNAPTPANHRIVAGASGWGIGPVRYRDCLNVPDMDLLRATRCPSQNQHVHRVRVGVAGARNQIATSTTATDYGLDLHDQDSEIVGIEVFIDPNSGVIGATNKTFSVYSDSARTALISTITIPGSESGIMVPVPLAAGAQVSEGVFFRMTNPDGTTHGDVFVNHRQIGTG